MTLRVSSLVHRGIVLLLVALGACTASPVIVDHEILTRGSFAGMSDSGKRFDVIQSEPELSALYDQLYAGRLPQPPVPEVDFTRFLVVFVAMEQKPSAGYRIELGPPTVTGDILTIRALFHEPRKGSPRAMVLTRPFAVIRVRRSPGVEAVQFMDGTGRELAQIPLK